MMLAFLDFIVKLNSREAAILHFKHLRVLPQKD